MARPGRVIITRTLKVAVESGFYTTEAQGGSASAVLEDRLADIDGEANRAFEAVIANGTLPAPSSTERETLAYYLAIQKSRTPEARAFASFPTDVLAYAGDRTVDRGLIAEYLEQVHLGFKPSAGEISGALTFVQASTELYSPLTRNEIVTLRFSQ
ncbi:DUF4238 domain-containing protein [Amycolatopsis albispora]|uniref:Uncharacterized protein n=1 Tax=Amycolatopsis albispora TaxID=1804986 RepID=A0A344L6L7_9PSEU|nr:DUF4238 domain-containing protein [Amycolatopsis albispora]AXB43691.1 hypothetical protein A4R43_15080 [Amycolatopsis albispora]